MAATVEESTPPDMATAMVVGSVMSKTSSFETGSMRFVVSDPFAKYANESRHPGTVEQSTPLENDDGDGTIPSHAWRRN